MLEATCCCCRDVYFWNADGTVNQFRTEEGSTTPEIANQLFSFYSRFAIDYRNQRTIILKNFAGTNRLITRTEDLDWVSPIDVALGSADSGGLGSVAIDYIAGRIFYISVASLGPAIWQIRKVNFDGTGDAQVITEPVVSSAPFGTSEVTLLAESLTYDPDTDKLYYVRQYETHASGGNQTRHIELRSVISDGTGQATEATLETFGPHVGGIPEVFTVSRFHTVPSEGFVAAGIIYADSVFAGSQDNYLSLYDMATGARTDILHSVNDLVSPFRRYGSPQYCYKDGKLYFSSIGIRMGPPATDYNFANYDRINIDGSGQETVFNFSGVGNPFNWAQSTGFISQFRLGCEFENLGDEYVGTG